MEIIKTDNNSAYKQYELLLLERDALLKEADEYLTLYIHEFGDLLVEKFKLEVTIISTKKSIAFCQVRENRGERINLSELNDFIDIEMNGYNELLKQMVKDNENCRQLEHISKEDNLKIKRLYRKLARQLHPDLNPELQKEPWFADLWTRISTAYKCADLKELEDLVILANAALTAVGVDNTKISIPDITERSEQLQSEINKIIITEPYSYKNILVDPIAKNELKHELRSEIKQYELYLERLRSVLTGYLMTGVIS